jgi:hypothetical protein
VQRAQEATEAKLLRCRARLAARHEVGQAMPRFQNRHSLAALRAQHRAIEALRSRRGRAGEDAHLHSWRTAANRLARGPALGIGVRGFDGFELREPGVFLAQLRVQVDLLAPPRLGVIVLRGSIHARQVFGNVGTLDSDCRSAFLDFVQSRHVGVLLCV